eukprot:369483_1
MKTFNFCHPKKKQKTTQLTKFINFLQDKPSKFVQKVSEEALKNSIDQYMIYRQDQLAQQANIGIENEDDKEQFFALYQAIKESCLINNSEALIVPDVIILDIAKFAADGKWKKCGWVRCDKEILVWRGGDNYYVRYHYCNDKHRARCDQKSTLSPQCDKCGEPFNKNTIKCPNKYCSEYICENQNCEYFKDLLPKCGRDKCESKFCGLCVNSGPTGCMDTYYGYYRCGICENTNIGCSVCENNPPLWCDRCEENICDDCNHIEIICPQCDIKKTHRACTKYCPECWRKIGDSDESFESDAEDDSNDIVESD